VTVVTGFPNHPTGILRAEDRGKLWATEQINGIRVLRNWLYATPNEGIVKKTLGHLTFMVTAVLFGLPRLGKIDVLIASSPTFFPIISAWIISLIKRIPFVFEVRDLWPAVFVDLGVLKNPWLIKILEMVEMFLYRRAALVVTVTESFRDTLIKRGIPGDKIVTVTNGADIELFQPDGNGNHPRQEIRQEYGLENKFTVMYLGAHGISHSLETVVRAAEILRDETGICFLLVGEGAEKNKLVELKQQLNLTNLMMLPGQPKARVPGFYQAADVCLVMLRDVPLFTTFIPSKMFEIMAAARPIIGAVKGESEEILERSGNAFMIEQENPASLAAAVRQLLSDPVRCEQMAAKGRDFVIKNYSRESLAEKYMKALVSTLQKRDLP
jgi:glycosyltransferase involved in cell wall biosynthesis